VGQMVSVHVIPRPHEEIEKILPEGPEEKKAPVKRKSSPRKPGPKRGQKPRKK